MSDKQGDRIIDLKPTLTQLVARSAQTLEAILQDDGIDATERADIALRIVALAGGLESPIAGLGPVSASAAKLQTASSGAVAEPQPPTQSPTQLATPTEPACDPYADFPDFLPGKYVLFDDFLPVEENEAVLQLAIDRQEEYVASSTSTNAEKYRSSWVLYPSFFSELYHRFGARLRSTVPDVVKALELPEFDIEELEMQLTAHGDGNFYKVHNDSDGEVVKRTLTYVYYFNREPKPYRGGSLRMYETDYRNGWIARQQYRDIEPKNNRLVLFDSRCMHEVCKIESDSAEFADCRFTLNGWLRRP